MAVRMRSKISASTINRPLSVSHSWFGTMLWIKKFISMYKLSYCGSYSRPNKRKSDVTTIGHVFGIEYEPCLLLISLLNRDIAHSNSWAILEYPFYSSINILFSSLLRTKWKFNYLVTSTRCWNRQCVLSLVEYVSETAQFYQLLTVFVLNVVMMSLSNPWVCFASIEMDSQCSIFVAFMMSAKKKKIKWGSESQKNQQKVI